MKLRFTLRARRTSPRSPITSSPQSRCRLAACAPPFWNPAKSCALPPHGRPQQVEGVRKLVTRKYAYLVYPRSTTRRKEVIVITIQHPAREREFEDA